MQKKEKERVVEDLKQKLSASKSVILTDFSGISVKQITQLRKDFRAASIECLVAKNTLIKRAVDGTPLKGLEPYLKGPTALLLSPDEGIMAAKIIRKFAEDTQKLAVKAGVLSDRVIDSAQVKSIASLPSREVLLARMMGCLNSPISGLVFVLNDLVGRSVRVLDQIRQAKQAQESK
jgi:large subunit ribosomal protein L10